MDLSKIFFGLKMNYERVINGRPVGYPVGEFVEGLTVGLVVGLAIGLTVGFTFGLTVGLTVGLEDVVVIVSALFTRLKQIKSIKLRIVS